MVDIQSVLAYSCDAFFHPYPSGLFHYENFLHIIVLWGWLILPMSFRVTSLALGQSLPQCQWSNPEGNGKMERYQTMTTQNKPQITCIILGMYYKVSSYQYRIFFHSKDKTIIILHKIPILERWHHSLEIGHMKFNWVSYRMVNYWKDSPRFSLITLT